MYCEWLWILKISCEVFLAIAWVRWLMPKFWNQLGHFQVFMPFVAGLILAAISMDHFSWGELSSYALAGSGSIVMYEIYKAIKNLLFPPKKKTPVRKKVRYT